MKQNNMRRVPQTKGAPVNLDAPAKSVPSIACQAGGMPCDKDSEWVRLPRPGTTLRGFSRSFLFQLCKAGTLESIVIQGPQSGEGNARARKSSRGVRLLLLSSLDGFLAKQRSEQAASRSMKAGDVQ